MPISPGLRTTVIGSYPFPGWLEFACQNLERFGEADRAELVEDAVTVAVRDQLEAGLDVITDGEQTRLDFNLSFYGYLEGIELEAASPRRFGPPAHDQRGRHAVTGELRAPRGLGVVEEWERLRRVYSGIANCKLQIEKCKVGDEGGDGNSNGQLAISNEKWGSGAGEEVVLKASVPGPYTLSGRLVPGERYEDRWGVTEGLLPIVRGELEALVAAGCREITVDEPSMSCYAHREDPGRFVEIFNRTVAPVVGRCRLSTHLCFGNYKGRAVGPRQYAPMFPAFMELAVDEIHLEMASREFAELALIGAVAEWKDVAVGIVDVKSYYVETPEDVAERVRRCLEYAPAERLSFAPDCGLSQTARWAARAKLQNMVAGVRRVREEISGTEGPLPRPLPETERGA